MIYFTQLIFLKPGCEQQFDLFEEKVIPLLKDHNGELIYRIRPDKSSVVEGNRELPYEIHLIAFKSKVDFEYYKNDPERLNFIELRNNSVKNVILIEGREI
jgi:uncharacterized protein (DUF1330 family)